MVMGVAEAPVRFTVMVTEPALCATEKFDGEGVTGSRYASGVDAGRVRVAAAGELEVLLVPPPQPGRASAKARIATRRGKVAGPVIRVMSLPCYLAEVQERGDRPTSAFVAARPGGQHSACDLVSCRPFDPADRG